jgi:hypothetical protein
MHADRRCAAEALVVQRAIVLQVLRDDHRQRWTERHLETALSDVAPEAAAQAVLDLEASGVLCRLDEFVGASRCARCLDSLGLIAM